VTFKPGQSGNPLGRKPAVPGALTAKDALTSAAPQAVMTLIKAMRYSKDEKIQIAAADMILRRVLPSGVKIELDVRSAQQASFNYASLSLEERRKLLELMRKAQIEDAQVIDAETEDDRERDEFERAR